MGKVWQILGRKQLKDDIVRCRATDLAHNAIESPVKLDSASSRLAIKFGAQLR